MWSEVEERIVEIYYHAEKLNHENAASLTKLFLGVFEQRKTPLDNLCQLLSDSAPVLRGKVNGAHVRIGREYPRILSSDIGGDGLHHIHNAEARACKEAFSETINILNNIKRDLRLGWFTGHTFGDFFYLNAIFCRGLYDYNL